MEKDTYPCSFVKGRQTYEAPEPANDILRHRDHVHVDVLRGEPR